MATYYGYVMSWPGGMLDADAGATRADRFFSRITTVPEMVGNRDAFTISKRWRRLVYASHEPLRGEQRIDGFPEVFRYRLLIRVSEVSHTVIIGSETTKITNLLVKRMQDVLSPQLQSIQIRVDALVEHLLGEADPPFAMTRLVMDVPSQGNALKTMSLAGDDIARAKSIQDVITGNTTKEVGLRDVRDSVESAGLGSAGTVRFYDNRLEGVERCLQLARSMNLYVL